MNYTCDADKEFIETAYYVLETYIRKKKMNDMVGNRNLVEALREIANDIEKEPMDFWHKTERK